MLTANESLVACKIGYCFCNDSFIRIFFSSTVRLLFAGKFSFAGAVAVAVVAVAVAVAAVDIDHSLTPNSTTFKMSFLFFVVVFFPFVYLPIRALLTLPTNFT